MLVGERLAAQHRAARSKLLTRPVSSHLLERERDGDRAVGLDARRPEAVVQVDRGERHRLDRVVVSRFRRRHGTLSVTDRECAANQRGHTDEPPESFRHGPMIPPERRRWRARGVTTARSGDKSLVFMNRRDFLKHSSAALALSAFPGYAFAQTSTPKRVGLIGSGWYGKCDLFRLMQVAPVEVVSLCDVDSRMLADAADAGRGAPGVEEDAAHLRRLPRDARARRTSTSS